MKKIVVIDDSKVALRMSSKRLTEAGYEVVALEDPGRLDATASPPDLVLVDVNMPRYFGDALVPYLREECKLTAPIFLFSQLPEEELEQLADACGATGYICKDPELDELVTTVNEVLR